MTFRASRFQNFLGKKPQDPPSGSPDRHSRDSSGIENIPILHTQKVGQSRLDNFFKLQIVFLQRLTDLCILSHSQL